jgi:predicted RNA-binding Zn-ribbon protein involved in translation (DUF1610 family)
MDQFFRCMSCRVILPEAEAVNRPWQGWRTVAGRTEIVPVDNLTCPACGSNDLIWRETGDQS